MSGIVYLSLAVLAMAYTTSAMMIDGKQMTIDEAIIKAGSNGSMSKMYELMQDEKTVMVELDMLYKMDTYTEMRKDMVSAGSNGAQGSRTKRKAIRAASYRWPSNRIPYEISYEFSSSDRNTINLAINDYHRYTCLRFAPATSSDRNKVRFQNGGGCSSYVGLIGGTQPISLARGCRYKGIVIHEMGHAIGFQHEQTRPDRDSFVSIQTQNIQRGVEYNFMRYASAQVNSYGVPYDYTSVMHYSQNAFTANGRPTIIARDSRFQNAMGNRDGLSYKDIQLANTMYECAKDNRCAARNCPQGFQGPDCECWCDSGDRKNPIRVCDGTAVTTERPEATTTPGPTRPMSCEDSNQYCPRWAGAGYCTGTYANYMMVNCKYSCNYCAMTTTVMPTPPVTGCTDKNTYCSYWAGRGECSRNPSYMNANCQRSCNTCDGTAAECRDSNANCPSWTAYCDTYREYLHTNCRRSCGICTANDADITSTTPATSSSSNQRSCSNKYTDAKCAKHAHRCTNHCMVRHNCEKTCGLC